MASGCSPIATSRDSLLYVPDVLPRLRKLLDATTATSLLQISVLQVTAGICQVVFGGARVFNLILLGTFRKKISTLMVAMRMVCQDR